MADVPRILDEARKDMAMFEDLAFAAGAKPMLMDVAAYSAKSSQPGASLQPVSARRRPRPGNLVRAVVPPLDFPIAPKPPRAPAAPRPGSVPPNGTAAGRMSIVSDCGAEALAPPWARIEAKRENETDISGLRHAFNELQKKYDAQSHELAALRQQVKDQEARGSDHEQEIARSAENGCEECQVPSSLASRPSGAVEMVVQACQTEEKTSNEQFDKLLREGAQKSKEMRALQETLRTLRAELAQEKMMSEQFRGQVEGLETQLQKAVQSKHRAETDRNVADWHLRQAERQSRASTPQPSSARVKKAWGEADIGGGRPADPSSKIGCQGLDHSDSDVEPDAFASKGRGRSFSGDALALGIRTEMPLRRGRSDEDDESGSEADSASSSDADKDLTIFHPPPSRAGMRR